MSSSPGLLIGMTDAKEKTHMTDYMTERTPVNAYVLWIDAENCSAVPGAGIVVVTIKSFEVKTYSVLC